MFERFTERARQVVVLAQEEARLLKHNYIGTEHLLLGLLREHESRAELILHKLEVEPKKIVEEAMRMLAGPGGKMSQREANGGENIDAVERAAELAKTEKEAAIEAQQFEAAAGFRAKERKLRQRLAELQGKQPPNEDDEPKWYIFYDSDDSTYTKEGGWESKPKFEELSNGVMRFFSPALGDDAEVFVPAHRLIFLKIIKE
jgi:ATP-dependent Clp protease ATP-binding subunit ClpA